MSRPIEDYALIGDGETAALVSRAGSIDWLCWPRFDDDACFAALLGNAENGCWSLAPATLSEAAAPGRRAYLEDTLVIQTEFETAQGRVRLTDFMPRRDRTSGAPSSLVRIVEGLAGSVPMRSDLRLRFDYGMLAPWSECEGRRLVAKLGPDLIVLHAPTPLAVEAHCCVSEFAVQAGEVLSFVLRYGPSHAPVPGPIDVDAALAATLRDGREWIARFDAGRTHWPAAVKRSLLTLRALIHQPSGGSVAAPGARTKRAPGSSVSSRSQTTSACSRKNTTSRGAISPATSRRRSRIWR